MYPMDDYFLLIGKLCCVVCSAIILGAFLSFSTSFFWKKLKQAYSLTTVAYLVNRHESKKNMEHVVVCAAMRDKKTGHVLCSVRHWDNHTHWLFDQSEQAQEFEDEQGFVDNQGNFLTRTQAWHIAKAAGQIKRRCGGDTSEGGTLYSENLY